MHVVTVHMSIVIPGATSLKDKRMVLRSIVDRVRVRFNVAIAEVGSQDIHDRAELGLATVGERLSQANGLANRVLRFIDDTLEQKGMAEVIDAVFTEY